ncbi:YlbE-like family protein [Oceanobacillus halotolerans]|uniref:YlbE-like family protein n=1 Tax=Oceanobacillus halotolerans TaxID=2663380 RepID=UPI0013DADFD1|nr:YlbE-like family protein [Oceanobacillus halotolerans]
MQQEVYEYLRVRPHLLMFIRYNPVWYRYLMRDATIIPELEKEAKRFYGKTIPQRVEKIGDQVQMLGMLMHVANSVND